MSPRARVAALVALLAAAAAAAVVGTALLTGGRAANEHAAQQPAARPRRGAPPLVLDLGVRTDAEARALRAASALYARGRRAQAARAFARSRSLEAELGAAFAAWPRGSLERVRTLVLSHPRSAEARLHLGLALVWAGRAADAVAAWRAAERVEPDSPSAVRAADLLHQSSPRGLPTFVPGFQAPASIEGLPPARRLAALARAARAGGVRERLLYGVALQQAERPVSAERAYVAAAALDPGNAEAQVAAAVGRFSKENPSLAFARLGPLSRRFPHAPTVRFHLGLCLLWLGQVAAGRRQLALARADGPSTPLGREANRYLRRLAGLGTK